MDYYEECLETTRRELGRLMVGLEGIGREGRSYEDGRAKRREIEDVILRLEILARGAALAKAINHLRSL